MRIECRICGTYDDVQEEDQGDWLEIDTDNGHPDCIMGFCPDCISNTETNQEK